MIKNGDLKPKNIVHYVCDETEGLEICIIDWQDIKMLETNESLFNNLHKPIQLTEEILAKCGFEKPDRGCFQYKGIRLTQIRDLYFRGNFPIKADIKYLHQLQNLAFSLLNEELTIQL